MTLEALLKLPRILRNDGVPDIEAERKRAWLAAIRFVGHSCEVCLDKYDEGQRDDEGSST